MPVQGSNEVFLREGQNRLQKKSQRLYRLRGFKVPLNILDPERPSVRFYGWWILSSTN